MHLLPTNCSEFVVLSGVVETTGISDFHSAKGGLSWWQPGRNIKRLENVDLLCPNISSSGSLSTGHHGYRLPVCLPSMFIIRDKRYHEKKIQTEDLWNANLYNGITDNDLKWCCKMFNILERWAQLGGKGKTEYLIKSYFVCERMCAYTRD